MDDTIQKVRILYKGDILAAFFYSGLAVFLFIVATLIYYFVENPHYRYLVVGLIGFGLFCLGKFLYMNLIYRRQLNLYLSTNTLTEEMIQKELSFTAYRLAKKHKNRRRYTYAVVFFSVMAFLSLFSSNRGLFIGSFIPAALIAGIELGVGLLTEFRLREYHRILNKAAGIEDTDW